MDGIFLEFPLCCLALDESKVEKLSYIISYGIVNHSFKIKAEINQRAALLEKFAPDDFDYESIEDKKLLIASHELGITLGSINSNFERYSRLTNFINDYENKYGKDAYIRIGKKLCFETRDGQFDYTLFAILSAIQSNIGKKKKFFRITKDKIRYRMHGYKTKQISIDEKLSPDLILTDSGTCQ